jgi:hypothetical protein
VSAPVRPSGRITIFRHGLRIARCLRLGRLPAGALFGRGSNRGGDPRIARPTRGCTMSSEVAGQIVGIEGVVKWFDPRKGFGFIVGPEARTSSCISPSFRVRASGSSRTDPRSTTTPHVATRAGRPPRRSRRAPGGHDPAPQGLHALAPPLGPYTRARAPPDPLLIGFAVGVILTAVAARTLLRRHLFRTRSAERRARASERMAEIGAMTGGWHTRSRTHFPPSFSTPSCWPRASMSCPSQRRQGPALAPRRLAQARGRPSPRHPRRLSPVRRQLRIDPRPADINTIIEELADFFQPQAQAQGARLRLDLAKGR